ncbi:MAG: hypothetical protein U9P14_08805, partial [Gemmatimonadota bacterium]|nr:hypothetical protein [Gemmatimonadota bacterium]
MESKILYLAALCCLPTFFYLLFMLGKSIPGWIRRCIPGLKPEDIAQLALVMISVFCFGMSLFLVALLFMSQIPYYHREKSLVIALLFLLMGIICVQVFQFA